jgi:hypothetical protein
VNVQLSCNVGSRQGEHLELRCCCCTILTTGTVSTSYVLRIVLVAWAYCTVPYPRQKPGTAASCTRTLRTILGKHSSRPTPTVLEDNAQVFCDLGHRTLHCSTVSRLDRLPSFCSFGVGESLRTRGQFIIVGIAFARHPVLYCTIVNSITHDSWPIYHGPWIMRRVLSLIMCEA